MRLDEVKNYYQNLSDEDLRQQLNEDNTTGLSSDDLVKIVKAHSWIEVNIDDHLEEIRSLINKLEYNERSKKKNLKISESKKSNRQPANQPVLTVSNNKVKLLGCNLYRETFNNYSKNLQVLKKLEQFIIHKKNNPLAPFGSRDAISTGDQKLRNAVIGVNMKHAHLTHDVSIWYTIESQPPLIKLYGIFSHDESGTGQPASRRAQANLASRLSQASNWNDV